VFGANYTGIVSKNTYDDGYLQRATITEKVSLLPRRCYHSKKTLWFKKAYKAKATMYMLPNQYPKVITRWFDKSELLLLKLDSRS